MPPPEALTAPLTIVSVEPFVLRLPIAEPKQTPMGLVDSAIALFVRIETTAGEVGWGEVWCNFPRYGALHRALVVSRSIAPFLRSRTFDGPLDAFDAMHRATHVLRLQSGDHGPVSAAIAGIDIALWDIVARRERLPLWKVLGGASGRIGAYASTGRADGIEPLLEQAMAQGFRGIKMRCWGDPAQHIGAYERARAIAGPDFEIMADANSSWPLAQAADWAQRFAGVGLSFLEEPIPVDAPIEAWRALAARSPAPLAGGENMISRGMFDTALQAGAHRVLQPDACKWSGFSAGVPLARDIVSRGLRFCPHMFSGAVGLMAAAHLLAASGSEDGLLEYGIEHNPPRDEIARLVIVDGWIELGDAPGLGIELDAKALERWRVPVPAW